MAYGIDIWYCGRSIEYEFKYKGNYGAKGEKRAHRQKATPTQIKKQNQYLREKTIRRTIKLNFEPGDIWATLKYPKGARKGVSEVKDELKKFLDGMRYEYKKRGQPFKFIYRMEIGEKGGVHIHILVNRLNDKPDTDVLIQKRWPHGHVYYTSIYESGGYEALAEYIVKQPTEEIEGQLSLFPKEDRKHFIKYQTSKNLIRPEPVHKEYKRRTLRKLFEDGPTATPGYYIDKDSICSGTNPYTGMSYYYYTEVKIVDFTRSERRQE